MDGESGTGLGRGCSKEASVLLLGCHVVDGVSGCVEYDDVGRDIEDLDIDGVELLFLCLIGSVTRPELFDVAVAISGSAGLTAREERAVF